MPHTEQDTETATAESPAKKKRQPSPRIPVRVVAHQADSALVEWIEDGAYRRVYVPLSRVEQGAVASDDLAKGIPYGLPWEDFVIIEATVEGIANELRRQGVWTLEDLAHAKLAAVNRAFDQGEFIRRVTKEVNR